MTQGDPVASSQQRWFWLFVFVLIVVADLATKAWATESLVYNVRQAVFPGFNLTLVHNYGAAFSFLSDQPGWQRWLLSGLSIVISVVLVVWLMRLTAREKLTGIALALVLGGAIGNLVDRVRLGYVVDFLDVYYKSWHWPAFNIADSAISVGVVLLLIDGLILAPRRERAMECGST